MLRSSPTRVLAALLGGLGAFLFAYALLKLSRVGPAAGGNYATLAAGGGVLVVAALASQLVWAATRQPSVLQSGLRPRYFWGALAGVFVLSRLGTWGYPFDSDHWIFYYVGSNWLHGGSLYVTAWDHKPPLIFLYDGLLSVLFGDNIAVHRLVFTLLSLVDVYLFYRLCKVLVPRLLEGVHTTVGPTLFTQVAVLLYVFWRNLSQFTSSANNTENVGLVFVLGMLLAYLAFRADGRIWKLLVAGACLAVLLWLKPNFLLLGAPLVVLLIAAERRRLGRLVALLAVYAAPSVALTTAWLVYFGLRGTLHDFLNASFLFSSKYARSAWGGDLSSTSVRVISLGALLLLLFPVLVLGYLYVKDYAAKRASEAYWLVGLSVAAALFLTLDVGAFYPFYFLIAIPVFVVVMTYGLFRLSRLRPDSQQLVIVVVGVCMVASLIYSMRQLTNSLAGPAYADGREYQSIAAYVDAHTTPADAVFDYDYGATFYQLAGRRSGSRFVSASVLLLDHRDHYGFDLDAIFMRDLDASQAKYVIVPRNPLNIYYANTPIIGYFNSHYVLEKVFGHYLVLRRGTALANAPPY